MNQWECGGDGKGRGMCILKNSDLQESTSILCLIPSQQGKCQSLELKGIPTLGDPDRMEGIVVYSTEESWEKCSFLALIPQFELCVERFSLYSVPAVARCPTSLQAIPKFNILLSQEQYTEESSCVPFPSAPQLVVGPSCFVLLLLLLVNYFLYWVTPSDCIFMQHYVFTPSL